MAHFLKFMSSPAPWDTIFRQSAHSCAKENLNLWCEALFFIFLFQRPFGQNPKFPSLRAAPLFSFPCCAFYIAFPWCELACVGDSALVMAGIACRSILNYNTFRFLWSCDGQTREMDLHFLFFRCDSPKQCLQATFYENRAAFKNDQANFLSDKIMFQVPDQNSQILWFILCGDSRQIHCVYF